jgi:hypothetical protein
MGGLLKMRLKHALLLTTLILSLSLFLPLQASAQQTQLEIEATVQSHLIFDGDRLPVAVALSNVGGNSLQNVIVSASTGEKRAMGTIQAGTAQEVALFLENYKLGKNQVEIFATFSGGESDHIPVWFEVRPPEESVTLRVTDAPQSIYEGTVFTAQLQVQNLWQQAVSGVRIKNGDKVLYFVGALQPNQSLDISLRVEEYKTGPNLLQLVAEHERGSAPPVPLEFDVIPADSAVKVYLSSLSSATYPTEPIKLSLVVAASEQAGITQLELKALNQGIQPTGYYLGEQTAEGQEVPVIDVTSLLTGTSQTEEETTTRSVRGRELTFEVADPGVGTQPLSFQVSYRLGSVVVQREFKVDAKVLEAPSVRLIQAERIEAKKGEQAIVMLHVANDLPIEVEAVRVVPLGDIEASPSEFFIGTMSSNDFLPANFKIETDNLHDKGQLSFKLVYRIGRQTYETQPLQVTIHLEQTERTNLIVYIVPPVVVVLLVLIWWSLRRRKWTQQHSS